MKSRQHIRTNDAARRARRCVHPRSGVTLSEVLVSMLIMSVGVVSLATLFPISVIRTAQATQLTHAVFLRNNAEAAVESNLGILNNYYPVGSAVVNIAPNSVAVVDPLGSQYVGGALGGVVTRTAGGTTTVQAAQQLASLPDSWSLVFEDKVTSYTASQITVSTTPTGISLSTSTGVPINYRLVMLDATGKFAVLKYVSSVSGSTFGWTSSALPGGFVPARVRVETQTTNYSCLWTVRKLAASTGGTNDHSWVADVDVAVFFKRQFKAANTTTPVPGDETPFTLTFTVGGTGFDGAPGVKGVDDDGDGNTDYIAGNPDTKELGFAGSDDNRTVVVTGVPYLKKGSYMLEAAKLKWYRIVDFNTATGAILLDQEVRYSATAAATVTLSGIFMKGIVEVFPLGTRTGQQ
jgi:hypothetical protein